MCYIWAEEMKITWKDEGVLIFFILVPLLYPLVYSWIYTNEVVREVQVAVVDMSHSNLSSSSSDSLTRHPTPRLHITATA